MNYREYKPQTKGKRTGILNIIMFWITVIVFIGTCYGIANSGSIVLRKNHVTGTVSYSTKKPYHQRFNQNVQVTLDEETEDGIYYSRTFFNTLGKGVRKGDRVLVSYNKFNGNDGSVISISSLKFEACCFIILIIEIIGGVIFFRLKS